LCSELKHPASTIATGVYLGTMGTSVTCWLLHMLPKLLYVGCIFDCIDPSPKFCSGCCMHVMYLLHRSMPLAMCNNSPDNLQCKACYASDSTGIGLDCWISHAGNSVAEQTGCKSILTSELGSQFAMLASAWHLTRI
jgi:hypothetical protein